jgi:hypothetical protein
MDKEIGSEDRRGQFPLRFQTIEPVGTARSVGIRVRTVSLHGGVKCHVSVILMRLNVSDRTQTVVTALQRGLIHI